MSFFTVLATATPPPACFYPSARRSRRARGWASARRILTLADCVDACRRCARCNFVSLSFRPFHEECMWFHACPRFPHELRTVPTAPDMVTVDVRRT